MYLTGHNLLNLINFTKKEIRLEDKGTVLSNFFADFEQRRFVAANGRVLVILEGVDFLQTEVCETKQVLIPWKKVEEGARYSTKVGLTITDKKVGFVDYEPSKGSYVDYERFLPPRYEAPGVLPYVLPKYMYQAQRTIESFNFVQRLFLPPDHLSPLLIEAYSYDNAIPGLMTLVLMPYDEHAVNPWLDGVR